jgi:DNA-binding FadR family transcriptional regulator
MDPFERSSARERSEVDLGPVRAPSSATLVADSVRRLIALGGLSPGERLPSERRLAETLHVGRDSIRAAVRLLNEEGLAETRLGRRGGTFVTDLPVQPQRLSAEIIASHREIIASYEFRRTVEPMAARLAAQRADAEQIRTIVAIADEAAWSVRSWRAVDSRFHMAVAKASGNPFFVDAIYRTRTSFFGWYDAIYSRVPWDSLPIQDRDIGYFHRPIAEAIAERDPERAGELMSSALEWSERDLSELLDGFVADAAGGRDHPRTPGARTPGA